MQLEENNLESGFRLHLKSKKSGSKLAKWIVAQMMVNTIDNTFHR